MKLTLSVSGGFTGLLKEKTIDVNSLDEKTRASLIKYFEESKSASPAANLLESWSLDNQNEILIQRQKLTPELKKLYNQMKKNLAYIKE